ncbi:MAG: glycosyltransferase family 4 protein [Sedimentisphaerales bacterium]|nr:glycosyltransferase family 4 protein [Sedimentisphaerales bacterium]
MKIVHIITRLILGGAQENTLITCKGLAQRGHEVTLITGPAIGPEGELFEQARGQGFEIIVQDRLIRPIRPINDILAYFELKKLLTGLQPDIVHTHSAKAGILGRYAGAAIRPRPKIIHTVHGLAFHPYLPARVNRFYIVIEKAAARKTDAFLCVADAMTETMQEAGIGRDKPFTTAYSAIEEERFLNAPDVEEIRGFRRKYGIGEQAVVLVCIARLTELKGHEYIIESARRLSSHFQNCIWLFVGDGNLAEEIKRQIRLVNLQYRFKFTGLLPPDKIPLAIHSSDILVHCSLREGLARVLPQAMLCGKPVISFDIDGAREVVNDRTGRLIKPEDVDSLTTACEELITDTALRDRLGQNGRHSVIEKFSPDTMVNTIEKVYEELSA